MIAVWALGWSWIAPDHDHPRAKKAILAWWMVASGSRSVGVCKGVNPAACGRTGVIVAIPLGAPGGVTVHTVPQRGDRRAATVGKRFVGVLGVRVGMLG
jgi:hypothetical protein